MPNGQSLVIGLGFLAAGAFTLTGAFSDWAWFWNNRRAVFLASVITRTGARAVYTFLGLLLTLIGALATFGVIDMSKPPK
jgi:drug/metabolite transporter superfamily protein YnfA